MLHQLNMYWTLWIAWGAPGVRFPIASPPNYTLVKLERDFPVNSSRFSFNSFIPVKHRETDVIMVGNMGRANATYQVDVWSLKRLQIHWDSRRRSGEFNMVSWLVNHWFPLIRPAIQPLFLGGGTLEGVGWLISHNGHNGWLVVNVGGLLTLDIHLATSWGSVWLDPKNRP